MVQGFAGETLQCFVPTCPDLPMRSVHDWGLGALGVMTVSYKSGTGLILLEEIIDGHTKPRLKEVVEVWPGLDLGLTELVGVVSE